MTEMQSLPSLKDRCVLVQLKRTQWNARAFDRSATASIEANAGVVNVGRYNKALLKGNNDLKAVQQAFGAAYQYYKDHSLPWMSDGARIIPSEELLDFSAEVARLKENAMALVSRLYEHWDEAVQADANRMGPLFNPADYPTAQEMADLWSMRLVVMPISDGQDFRTEVSADVREALEAELRETEAKATEHCMKELLDPITAMAERLSVPVGEAGSVFRDTLVSNLKDAASRVKKLNINKNERIDQTCDQVLATLKGIDAQTLRDADDVRSSVAGSMRKLQRNLAAYMPR